MNAADELTWTIVTEINHQSVTYDSFELAAILARDPHLGVILLD